MADRRNSTLTVWARCIGAAASVSLIAFPAFARLPLAVPEPTTLSLIGGGVVGLIALYRMRRDK